MGLAISICGCVFRVCSYSTQNPLLRREALEIWKQRSGSSATYKKLINTFERAGRCDYAEIVRETVDIVESETDDSDCSDDVIPQPQTYPLIKPPTPPPSPKDDLSPFEEFSLIGAATARRLPKRKNTATIILCMIIIMACMIDEQ